jgi:hypothetical protein
VVQRSGAQDTVHRRERSIPVRVVAEAITCIQRELNWFANHWVVEAGTCDRTLLRRGLARCNIARKRTSRNVFTILHHVHNHVARHLGTQKAAESLGIVSSFMNAQEKQARKKSEGALHRGLEQHCSTHTLSLSNSLSLYHPPTQTYTLSLSLALFHTQQGIQPQRTMYSALKYHTTDTPHTTSLSG